MGETGRDFGKTGEDNPHRDSCENHCQYARTSKKSRKHGRQSKYPAADDAVHGESGQAPAADGANESFAGCGLRAGFGHREFVPQIADSLAERL